MSWPQLVVRAAFEGLAIGLLAAVVRRSWRATGRLDLAPVAAAVLVPVVAASTGPSDGVEALVAGLALLPAAGLVGAVLAAWVTEAEAPGVPQAARSPAQGAYAVLPAFLVLAGADAAARLRSGGVAQPFGAADGGPRLRGDVLISWAGLLSSVAAVAVVAAAAWLLGRGPLARAWRAGRAGPDLLALSGVEGRRVLAVIGAIAAVAGGAVGLAGASAAGSAPDGAWNVGLATAIVVVAVGLGARAVAATWPARLAPLAAGALLGVAAAAVDRRREGWGVPAVSAMALVLAWGRAWRFRRRALTGVVW